MPNTAAKKIQQEAEGTDSLSIDIELAFKQAQQAKKSLQLDKAIELFKSVLEEKPDHGWAHHCIAQSYHWLGDITNSVEHYNLAVEYLPFKASAISLHQLANIQKATGNRYHAYISIVEAHSRNSDEPQILKDCTLIKESLLNDIEDYFDPEYYFSKISASLDKKNAYTTKRSCAEHYLTSGWKEHNSVNWLFNEEYIKYQIENYKDSEPLVVQFADRIKKGERIDPSALFNFEYLSLKHKEKNPLQLLKSLLSGKGCDTQYSFLFDPHYYRQNVLNDIHTDHKTVENPYKHYVKHGAINKLDPHRLFRARFYSEQIESDVSCFLNHYYMQSVLEKPTPCPALVNAHYVRKFPDILVKHEPVLLHFIKNNAREDSIPDFDADHYVSTNPDIRGMCPYLHFAEHGMWEDGRDLFNGFSNDYIYSKSPIKKYGNDNARAKYYLEEMHKHKTVLLVSHSSSRTGAPLILLKIAKRLSAINSINLKIVVFGKGEIDNEFRKYAHVINTHDQYGGNISENTEILKKLGPENLMFVFANSAESRHFIDNPYLSSTPVFSLVHEIADHYEVEEWKKIFRLSEQVIFPSEFVAEKSRERLQVTESSEEEYANYKIISQGLLTEGFGEFGRDKNRQAIRKKYNIPEAAFVVFGCGTLDFRKGADIFYDVAKEIVENTGSEIYFLWLGGQQRLNDNHNFLYWKTKSAGKLLKERIQFVDSVADSEPFYQASDIFLMTSRSDPFPCVIHEAMSSNLPVVYMRDSGGCQELVKDEFGIGCEYESTSELIDAVLKYSNDKELVRKTGEKANEYIKNHYSYDSYVDNLCKEVVSSDLLNSDDEDKLTNYLRRESDSEKVSVYFLSPDWGLSGVNSYTEILVRELNKNNFDAKILFTRHQLDFSFSPETILPTVPYEFLNPGCSTEFPCNVWDAVLEYFKRHKPCIVVFNYDYICSSVSSLFPDHIGTVGVAHSDDNEHYEHVYRAGRYWNNIVSVSEQISERLLQINPDFKSSTITIKNGIEISSVHKQPKSKFGSPIRLLYAGRMVEEQKQVKRYIELAQELKSRNIDFVLDMLGDGEYLPKLKSLANELDLGNQINFHGRTENSFAIERIKQADLFLLFSDYEGLPISLLEALREGCVPIVYDISSGVADLVNDGENGFVCKTNTVEEAADRIVQCCLMDDCSELVGSCINTIYDNALSSEQMASSYIELFEELMVNLNNGEYSRPKTIEHGFWYKGATAPSWIRKEKLN